MTFIAGYIDSESVTLISDSVLSYSYKHKRTGNYSYTGEDLNGYQTSDAFKFIHLDDRSIAVFTSNKCSIISNFFDNLIDIWSSEEDKEKLIKEELKLHDFGDTVIMFAIFNIKGIPSILIADNRNGGADDSFILEWLSYDNHFASFGSVEDDSPFKSQSEDIFSTTDNIEFINDIDRMAINVALHQIISLDSSIIDYGAGGVMTGCNLNQSGLTYLPPVIYNVFEFKKSPRKRIQLHIKFLKIVTKPLGVSLFSSMNKKGYGKFDEYFEYSNILENNINMSLKDKSINKKRLNRRFKYDVGEGMVNVKNNQPDYIFNFNIADIRKKYSLSNINLLAVKNVDGQNSVRVDNYDELSNSFSISFDRSKLDEIIRGTEGVKLSLELINFN